MLLHVDINVDNRALLSGIVNVTGNCNISRFFGDSRQIIRRFIVTVIARFSRVDAHVCPKLVILMQLTDTNSRCADMKY